MGPQRPGLSLQERATLGGIVLLSMFALFGLFVGIPEIAIVVVAGYWGPMLLSLGWARLKRRRNSG